MLNGVQSIMAPKSAAARAGNAPAEREDAAPEGVLLAEGLEEEAVVEGALVELGVVPADLATVGRPGAEATDVAPTTLLVPVRSVSVSLGKSVSVSVPVSVADVSSVAVGAAEAAVRVSMDTPAAEQASARARMEIF
jgi:hypothetical protein